MLRPLSISFVMPMYNEKDNIETAIDCIKKVAEELTDEYEIIVVDDASIDGCGDIVEEISAKDATVKFYRLEKNTKFGGAFAKAFKSASKDVIMYMDSDMPVETDDIKASFPFIRQFDIVTGISKVKKGDTILRKMISGSYNFLVRMFFSLKIRDINSGYKIVRGYLVEDLEFISESPFIDVELFLHAKKKKSLIHEYPLVFQPRKGGRSYIASIPIIVATFRDMIKVWMVKRGKRV